MFRTIPRTLVRNASRQVRFQTTAKKQVTVNRDLPDPFKNRNRQRLQFGLFCVTMVGALASIFNYEKTSSPIVTDCLYHMRRQQNIRNVLGDNLELDGIVPWISGELNQVQGRVNIHFDVKGNKSAGVVKLVANRDDKSSPFLIHEWSLTVDGKKLDLLEGESSSFTF